MSRIELIVSAIKERTRQGRMNAHPHKMGCSGNGDIRILKTDQSAVNDPRLPAIDGKITQCTSCRYVHKTGTLVDDYFEPGGGGYY